MPWCGPYEPCEAFHYLTFVPFPYSLNSKSSTTPMLKKG